MTRSGQSDRLPAAFCLAAALMSVLLSTPIPARATVQPTREALSHLSWGQNATFSLYDSTSISGQYLGLLGTVPGAEYPRRYEQWRAAASTASSLPQLNSDLEATTVAGDTVRGVLTGVSTGLLVLQTPGSAHPRALLLSRVDRVRTAGSAEWMAAGAGDLWSGAPTLETVALRVSRDTLAIPLAQVRSVPTLEGQVLSEQRAALGAGGSMMLVILGIGAAIALAVILATSISNEAKKTKI